MATRPRRRSPVRSRELIGGGGAVLAGLRVWGTDARLMALGLIPGAITAAIFGAGAVALVLSIGRISESIASALVTGDGWFTDAVQVVAALAVLGAAALVGVYTFTAVTLLIGQPFFERLSRGVDERRGAEGIGEPSEGPCRSLVRGLGEALRLGILTVPLSVGLFLVGLVPGVGGILAFVLGAVFGGWFLALELTAYPLSRRGVVTLRERRAALRPHRARVIGFGATVFVLFLVPLGAVVFMPAAVAGATLLVHDVRGRDAVSPVPPSPPPG